MKKIVLAAASLLLAGCASVTQYHDACFDGNLRPFVQQAACAQHEISADTQLRQDPLAQEYVLTAVDLAHQVQSGKLTDDQARLQLTHKLNEINHLRAENLAAQNVGSDPAFIQPAFVGGYYRR